MAEDLWIARMLWSVSVEIQDESGECIPVNSMLVVHWCMWCLDKNLHNAHGNLIHRVNTFFQLSCFWGL